MPTRTPAPSNLPPADDTQPKTPGIKVIAWLLITASVVPMAMAAHGEGRGPLETGLVLLIAGVGLLTASRLLRARV